MKYFLTFFLCLNCLAFESCEIEQLLYFNSYDAIKEINKIIRQEKNPRDLKILSDIKSLLFIGDMESIQHIKTIIKIRESDGNN